MQSLYTEQKVSLQAMKMFFFADFSPVFERLIGADSFNYVKQNMQEAFHTTMVEEKTNLVVKLEKIDALADHAMEMDDLKSAFQYNMEAKACLSDIQELTKHINAVESRPSFPESLSSIDMSRFRSDRENLADAHLLPVVPLTRSEREHIEESLRREMEQQHRMWLRSLTRDEVDNLRTAYSIVDRSGSREGRRMMRWLDNHRGR